MKPPFVPPNTCVYLDQLNHMIIELGDLIEIIDPENTETQSHAESLVKSMIATVEHIRVSNRLLRESGKYWHTEFNNQCKNQKQKNPSKS